MATFTVGSLTYDTLETGGMTVTLCDGAATTAEIPEAVTNPESGQPAAVKAIAADAFANCNRLTTVTIPSSVTSIGQGAFRQCTGLQSIAIPGSVEEVDWETFSGCSSLTSVTLGEGVKSIRGELSYELDPWLPPTVVFAGAFDGCTSLTSITLPASMTSFDDTAFANTGLTHVHVAPGNATYGSFDGILTDAAIRSVAWCPSGRKGEIMLPSTVTSVPDGTFSSCRGITRINVDENNSAYASLDGILTDRSIRTAILCPLGWQGEIVLPDTVTKIEAGAFASCKGLTSIGIPGSVQEIPSGAFMYCSGLESVVIEPGVKVIGERAWHDATSPWPTRPDFVIDALGAFQGCSALRSVSVPGSVKHIGTGVFDGCVSLETVTLGQGVETIGDGSFQPDLVGAFSRCTNLASITIPRTVKSIGSDEFANCTALRSFFFAGRPPIVSGVLGAASGGIAFFAAGNRSWKPYVGKTFAGLQTRAIRRATSPALTAATGTDGTIRLQWTPPAATGGVPVVDYVIQVRPAKGTTWATYDDGISASTSADVTNLKTGRRYVFRVAAVTFAGKGAFTAPSKALAVQGMRP